MDSKDSNCENSSTKLIQSCRGIETSFRSPTRQKMLDTATQYLKSIPTTAKFRLELINDMVVPENDDGRYPLIKPTNQTVHLRAKVDLLQFSNAREIRSY